MLELVAVRLLGWHWRNVCGTRECRRPSRTCVVRLPTRPAVALRPRPRRRTQPRLLATCRQLALSPLPEGRARRPSSMHSRRQRASALRQNAVSWAGSLHQHRDHSRAARHVDGPHPPVRPTSRRLPDIACPPQAKRRLCVPATGLPFSTLHSTACVGILAFTAPRRDTTYPPITTGRTGPRATPAPLSTHHTPPHTPPQHPV
ncbi:hypothetical protein K505DRAFT_5302 [Melanomma pulvis-pyrius CBS 109.77]|uniref:Uncharacterized protein n=1 Tax=Melanomma pulvis-pyrius CBS 109.77 TaxID=1314802 RepID=A0A6A6XJA8_9PLEO|nr:hypothetical protein K505DRAFT_5302 [Melanomma pulvis-pyrius CBS 109.77]